MGARILSIPVLLPALLAACARASVRDRDLAAIESGEAAPDPIIFTCHGIFYDTGLPWDHRLREDLAGARRSTVLVITYYSDPTGVWFGWGRRAPGALIARIADAIEDLHRSTRCPAPLRFRAAGFSNGCEAVLEAAGRLRLARFDRVVLERSSGFAFSGEPRRLVDEGRIGHIRSRWSPFDLATLLAPLGAGNFGYRPEGPGLENLMSWGPHFPPYFPWNRERVIEDLFPPDGESAAPRHACVDDPEYRRRLADLLRREGDGGS